MIDLQDVKVYMDTVRVLSELNYTTSELRSMVQDLNYTSAEKAKLWDDILYPIYKKYSKIYKEEMSILDEIDLI